jgi:hypothetical protein
LKGQSDEESDRLAAEYSAKGNLPGAERHRPHRALIPPKGDLFVMTVTTVFRNLEDERRWKIDQNVRDRFNPKVLYHLYEQVLREDIPWRQWTQWIPDSKLSHI